MLGETSPGKMSCTSAPSPPAGEPSCALGACALWKLGHSRTTWSTLGLGVGLRSRLGLGLGLRLGLGLGLGLRLRLWLGLGLGLGLGQSRKTCCARSFMVSTWKSLARWKVITARSSKT